MVSKNKILNDFHLVMDALKKFNAKEKAAVFLGISERTLRERIYRYQRMKKEKVINRVLKDKPEGYYEMLRRYPNK